MRACMEAPVPWGDMETNYGGGKTRAVDTMGTLGAPTGA